MGDKARIDLPDELDSNDETNVTDERAFHGELTRKLNMLLDISKVDREIEARETQDPEATEDTSVVKTYRFVKKRVGLKKLVLDRFTKKQRR